jgi:hypothetical protein
LASDDVWLVTGNLGVSETSFKNSTRRYKIVIFLQNELGWPLGVPDAVK